MFTISSLNERKLKELAALLNEFVNHKKEDFFCLQWYLSLIDHVETKPFVNKEEAPKQYKTMNKLFHKQRN